MKLFHRLFGGRGIRSFSFWLTLWGLVCGAVWLIPFDPYAQLAIVVLAFKIPLFLNPLFWLVGTLFPHATELWMMPLLYVLFLYPLGRFLDWLFLKKSRKNKGGS